MTTTQDPPQMKIDIQSLTEWSPPKRVDTRNGPRLLCNGPLPANWWEMWEMHKPELQAAGISCGRHYKTQEWELCWWQQLPAKELAKIKENIEASQRLDANVEIARPEGLDYRPYQRAGIAYSRGKDGILFGDEMGLGKTIEAIGVINDNPHINSILVICPVAVKLNWQRELSKWLVRKRDIAIVSASNWPGMADCLIINWDILGRHLENIQSRSWDIVIADEIHVVRNTKTQRYKALKATQAPKRVGLTGTPILNQTMDLWAVLNWLDPETYKSWFAFRKKFSNNFGGSTKEQRLKLQARLRETLMVRRLKSEVLKELPSIQRQVIELNAPEGFKEIDDADISEADEELVADLQVDLELAKASEDPEAYKRALERLREGQRIAFDSMAKVRHNTAVAKIPYTIAHINECLESKDKLVVWLHHKDCAQAFMQTFGDRAVLVDGSLDAAKKDTAVQKFINDPKVNIFFGSTRAAGTGIDGLQKVCDHQIFHELDWVPLIMEQAAARLHRIGQEGSVLVQVLVFSGTIDANMAQACVAKLELAEQSLDADRDQLLTEPLLPTKQRASHITITKKEMEALTIDPSVKSAVHSCLQMIAQMCDGAHQVDGHGFNKFDSALGRRLAMKTRLSDPEGLLGQKLVRKYRKQLPDTDLIATALQL